MTDKIALSRVVIVEGKYDKSTLASFLDAPIFVTGGFRIFHQPERLALLRRMAEEKGAVILTDSDRSGFRIRGYLSGAIPPEKLLHAYIPDILGKEARKTRPSAQGLLGVEGMTREILLDALRRCGALEDCSPPKNSLQKKDLMVLGLTGPGSRVRRQWLEEQLSLPAGLSCNGLLAVLRVLYTPGELAQQMNKYSPKED
ncbi:MAG: DUF4093 domain-containing protein [Oscillospiraceae bacterium]|nr:DUF4093 domain-containing protein [Oscillospiraceae bacterium]MBQ8732088.1 DUF4093 domain-containing protein [Oscillospiraceae bacterium]